MQNIKTGMPIVNIQAVYKTQKPCFELEEHFLSKILKNTVSHVHNNQLLNLASSEFLSRSFSEASKDSF